jgi:hypothetical protein
MCPPVSLALFQCCWGDGILEVMSGAPIPVEILHTAGCGNWRGARDAVSRVAEERGVAVAVSERVVDTPQAAQTLRFPGSPTVRLRGRDLQPEVEARQDYGLG